MFGWTRIFTLVAVTAAVAILTSGAGATSTSTLAGGAGATSKSIASGPAATSESTHALAKTSRAATAGKVSTAASRGGTLLKTANLSTRAGVVRYLRAIGIDQRGLVIQRGARNYAGPNCPGAGWACTSTAHPVIQIAAAGGKNTFLCTSGSCAVVQTTLSGTALMAAAATNKSTCIKTTGLGQSCSISQTGGGPNMAFVYENSGKLTGLTQTASQTASITQVATGANANTACVTQAVNLDGSTNASGKKGSAINVALEAHQTITISQTSANGSNTAINGATASGGCDATLNQAQTLSSTVTGTGSITQNENVANNGANMKLDITQNQNAGTGTFGPNTATFDQTNSLTATANGPGTVSLPVSQTQSTLNGGILAAVNQSGPGVSTATATQTETQCEDAALNGLTSCSTTEHSNPSLASLTQTQHGPVRKAPGDSSQTGNSNDSFTVVQNSRQDSDSGSTQSNVVEGGYTTDGTGSVTQDTNVNGTPTHNMQAGPTVEASTNCTGSTCTSGGSGTSSTLTLLPTGFSVSHTDIAGFGIGGMRGTGTGTIVTSGITGPVAHAFLYWHGPTNSADPASNASVTFNGTAITGANIGTASDNNWSFTNSQAYRADVTSLVTGNASYSLSNFLKADADINGVSLIVFYDDGNPSNDRNVVAWNGNDSNVTLGPAYNPDGWDETISGVPYPGSGAASLDLVVSDGQTFNDDAVVVNGSTLAAAGPIFQGDAGPNGPAGNGSLWDVKSFDITGLLTSGTNSVHLTTGVAIDYLSLVVAIADVPASAPVIP